MLAMEEETSMPSSSNQIISAKAKIASTSAMKLQYVTQRIIAALFPSDSTDAQYRTDLKDATVLLRRNHSEHYKIFNLSKKRNDLGRLHSVVEVGWPEELAPPLDRLCSICKLLENWLSENAQNVVVIHCKGGCSRAAIVIAAYMHYITICSNDEISENRFALQQFSEYYLGPNGQPSHKRVVAENNTFEMDDLPLRGDILVKCFQRTSTTKRALFFRCQFNTCTFDLSTNNENIYKLRFYREELDNIFNDSEVNSQAVIEFIFLIDVTATKNSKNDSSNNDDNGSNNNDTNAVTANDGAISSSIIRKSIADNSRADSYENFDKEEEEEEAEVEVEVEEVGEEEGEEEDRSELSAADCLNGAAYVEIHRPTDSTDSGLGSDSANITKEKSGIPPLPPPKPRINLEERMNATTDHYYSEQTRGNDQVITRAHSVLPASVRSNLSVRSGSPADEQHVAAPHGIEPDLVAKDRYDPASKCFSYVPARALSEHFTAPRKPQRLKIEETATAALNISPSASEIAMVPIKSTDLQRLPETPKWEDDIEKITNGIFFGENSKITDMSVTPTDFNRTGNGPIANSTPKTELSKLNYPVNDEEKPVIVEQAKHVPKRRKTRYDSYKTLNDDAYNSDLDDLCDPDFYLTYTPQTIAPIRNNAIEKTAAATTTITTTTTTTTSDAVAKMNESNLKSNEMSGKNKIYQNQSNFDEYFLSSKPTISLNNINQNREAFRMRNCRSATSAPFYRESSDNRLFAHNRYDSLTDAENADDWLKFQLKKLKAKRENNPEMLRRKRQEKLLLEELKHVNDDKQITRENNERTYSLESYGKSIDPLIEYRIEEERLQNVRSPYHDNDDDNRINDEMINYANRKMKDFNNSSALPPKPSDIVKHKPPTPPLRPRSQSPSSSPYLRRCRIRTPFQESQYQRERNQINRGDSIEHDNGDFDDNEFSHLKNIIKENNIGSNNAHVELNSSTNSMKSILKKRDVQQNGSSSPLINRTPSNSTEDWSLAPSSNRAATPTFPVRRETPQPYHPLLFEGAKDVIPPMQPINNITYRSPSPRSIYYAQSHRTSISSTGL
uniref:Phosphatase tensin-type domain-containing protein n=1 Tax=Wuchereria bancrofti TaxID=6293 RepID=A0AAF5Q5V1_WUCBA